MRRGIFITVRTSSSRLPNKALMKICNKPTIEYAIDRAKQSTHADVIVLCTSTDSEDNALCELAHKNGIECFRGSLIDKIDRWLQAALEYEVDYFVNIDGDDLFCEPELIDMAFEQYDKENHDFVKCDEENLVVGAFTLGAKTSAIQKVCEIKDTDDTEAAWLYFSEMDIFKTSLLKRIPEVYNRPDIRATLDYYDDFLFFSNIIEHFGAQKKSRFSLLDVVKYIDENPRVLDINRNCQQKYLNNQQKLTKLIVKKEYNERA
jgi:spore coat polysaccharide biosynthesis protein SpsF